MKSISSEKWIEGVSSDDRIADVARQTLHNRLAAVLHFLPLAAEHAEEDVEYVHQLRVWTRRADAAVRLYEELLPRHRLHWITKQLRRVRHAANGARDCDVLLQRLAQRGEDPATKHWQHAALVEREKAQKAIVDIHDRLCNGHDRFARRIDKLLRRLRANGATSGPFGHWARERLRGAVERFCAAIPGDCSDVESLHRFRIHGKELRYDMELLVGAFPDSFRTSLYPAVEAILDRLGQINDLATAVQCLRNKVEAADDAEEAENWRRLLDNESALLEKTRAAFQQWCSGEGRLKELYASFTAVLGVERNQWIGTDSTNHSYQVCRLLPS